MVKIPIHADQLEMAKLKILDQRALSYHLLHKIKFGRYIWIRSCKNFGFYQLLVASKIYSAYFT